MPESSLNISRPLQGPGQLTTRRQAHQTPPFLSLSQDSSCNSSVSQGLPRATQETGPCISQQPLSGLLTES